MSKYLKDEIANIILSDKDCRDFLVVLVSKALDIDLELVKNNLELISNRVNDNIHTKYSFTDVAYENDSSIINIEVNLKENEAIYKKNMRYVCHLILRQVRPGEEDNYKPVNQINLNYFDTFKANKFIYRSAIMETSLHKKRDNSLNVVDINLDFLKNIDYTIIEREKDDSLEKMLYFFVCNNSKTLDKLYVNNEI